MAVIDESSEPAMAHVDKETASLNLPSECTTGLEEDEDDLSQVTDEFVSNSCVKNDDDGISCTSMQSDVADEMHHIRSPSVTRVRFAPMASHHLTISLDEYTQDEIEDAFWTPMQMDVLNKARRRTIARLATGLEEKKSSPYRGLEKSTFEGYLRGMETRNAYINTVMDEMERLRRKESENVSWDWEKSASLTEEMTKRSAQRALKIALYDFDEARTAYLAIEAEKDLEQSQQSKSFSNMRLPFSGYLRQVRAGITNLPIKRTSKSRKPSRLESIFQIAEGPYSR